MNKNLFYTKMVFAKKEKKEEKKFFDCRNVAQVFSTFRQMRFTNRERERKSFIFNFVY